LQGMGSPTSIIYWMMLKKNYQGTNNFMPISYRCIFGYDLGLDHKAK
jgi:hypothetical protein